jgi:hypothetical protein
LSGGGVGVSAKIGKDKPGLLNLEISFFLIVFFDGTV